MLIDCIASANGGTGSSTAAGFDLNGTTTCLLLRCIGTYNTATGAAGNGIGLLFQAALGAQSWRD